MKLPRRQFLQLASVAAALPAVSRIARAQTTYPTRPITMIVPAAAGGSTDVIGRVLAERMRGSLGQPIILENVSGADGSIGVGRAARARPDGYTIDLGFQGTHVLNGAFYSLQYDLLNDFAPISPLITYPNVVFARKTMPANNLKELIAWMKANPDKASAGIGGAVARLLTAFFQKETGTQFTLVPYRGVAPLIKDAIPSTTPMNRCFVPIARGIERSWKERYTRVSHAKLKPSRLGVKNPSGPSQVPP